MITFTITNINDELLRGYQLSHLLFKVINMLNIMKSKNIDLILSVHID